MTRVVVPLTLVAMLVAISSGCQSGPRWAFWKKDTPAAVDSSAIARSAPALPSAQVTPNAVAASGQQPATPPSSANLASAAGAPTTTTASPNSNIYPTTGAPPVTAAAAAAPAINTNPVASAMSTTATSPAVAPGGPYDPNAYRPSSLPTTGSVASTASSADRYGALPVAASAAAPTTTAPYASTPQTSTAAAPAGAYGSNVVPVAAATQSAAPSAGDRYGILPVAGPSTASSDIAVGGVPAVNAQVATPTGVYRPGGTSDYVPATVGGHVEVATRPSPAPASTAPATSAPGSYQPSPYGTSPY